MDAIHLPPHIQRIYYIAFHKKGMLSLDAVETAVHQLVPADLKRAQMELAKLAYLPKDYTVLSAEARDYMVEKAGEARTFSEIMVATLIAAIWNELRKNPAIHEQDNALLDVGPGHNPF